MWRSLCRVPTITRLRIRSRTTFIFYLLVEVADASLDFDRQVKGPLYAENGVAEYWILNLPDRTLEVHRQPLATGQYAEVRVLQAGDSTDLVKLPGVTLAVAELFPPAAER
jgi:Uma2 family endonuclease